ncbi:MAG: arsenosugar biosynthesis radical SAM (seleno)protein ArsS [Nitrospinota bacterium]
MDNFTPFEKTLEKSGQFPLRANGISVLQVNLGKRCNMACKHCHVDAGSNRTEAMSPEIVEHCLRALKDSEIPTVDITGGSPEMHPRYREFAAECAKAGKTVITRTNLTILLEKGYDDLIDFFKEHRLEVIASLPYYRRQETDAMRGKGTFDKSIEALRKLNDAGYGKDGSGLALNLVYNPAGAFLPPPQETLENDFKNELGKRYGIVFNNLFALTNMPIARFLDYLKRSGNYAPYINKLVNAYNPSAAECVMCKNTVSISWDGLIYDCDFNQMLDIPVNHGAPSDIRQWDLKKLSEREVMIGLHCYGCTAGGGSSCGGQIA